MTRTPLLPRFSPLLRGFRRAAPLAVALAFATAAWTHPTISGTVLIAETGKPARDAEVLLIETDQVVHTDNEGSFAFVDVDHIGSVTLHVDLGFLSAVRTLAIDIEREEDIELAEPIVLGARHRMHERVTVTASASDSSPFQTFGSVHAMEGLDLHNESARTLAELLEGTTGVAVRSFGPGSARPIVRGFDGDRVLTMEDGVRTSDLGSQSADHGVPVDPLQAERVEVVRGPATLLYGSNAIGGTVNVISMASHLAHSPPPGFRGQANVDYSTADAGMRGGVRAQASGGNWFAWGGGNANRTEDYDSPAGVIENTHSSMNQGEAGFGVFGERAWLSGSVRLDDARYGVPFAGDFHGSHVGHDHGPVGDDEALTVDVTMNRRQFRTDFGFRGLGFLFDEAQFTVRYADYDQDEIETFEASGEEIVATHFDNRSVVFRGELRKPAGRVNSRVGVWGNVRDYEAWGHEALAPETRQNAFAAFTYNEIEANERLDLLLGARAERNAYDVGEDTNPLRPAEVVDRTFLTASASTGARLAVGSSTAVVGVASLATRAPSLEELYNFGPHIGNLAYEIGNPELDQERSLGFDLSLRQSSEALTGSLSVFRYDISNFVFGEVLGGMISGLPVWLFQQSDATYQGFEAEGHLSLGAAELVANAAYVDAKLASGEYVPRIPPLGGHLRLDVPVGKLRLAPRLRWASRMDRLYRDETPTDGYAVFDFTASYVFVGASTTSNISLGGYNLTNAEYSHHNSLIKDMAPQMGRGFRISYSLRFY